MCIHHITVPKSYPFFISCQSAIFSFSINVIGAFDSFRMVEKPQPWDLEPPVHSLTIFNLWNNINADVILCTRYPVSTQRETKFPKCHFDSSSATLICRGSAKRHHTGRRCRDPGCRGVCLMFITSDTSHDR